MFKLFLFTRFAGRRTSPASKEIIHVMEKWRKHCDKYWARERKNKARQVWQASADHGW
ncbi:hypothetical protein ACMYSP_05635 [Klebsiella sp. R390]|uniref:Uncharacterized protein n=1 Tax=Raoultella lignicola TaxID=3040939 RepID=A0ABU9FFB9_9ENTR|nr:MULTISPECIES: hypothetical protein [Enterobacteriaceae]QNK10018.1 hypothetical protein HF679_11580 [Enterobacter sp. JUb54]